MIYMLIIALGF